MSVCSCPQMPEMGPRDPIPVGPVTCVCCGQPLELTCAGHCDRVAESFAAAVPERNAEVRNRAEETRPRHYVDKRCACGQLFSPIGPRSMLCPACVAAKAVG